jgi:hypothetical protein
MFAAFWVDGWLVTDSNSITIKKRRENENKRKNNRLKKR